MINTITMLSITDIPLGGLYLSVISSSFCNILSDSRISRQRVPLFLLEDPNDKCATYMCSENSQLGDKVRGFVQRPCAGCLKGLFE